MTNESKAEALAAYLGMSAETHPEAYRTYKTSMGYGDPILQYPNPLTPGTAADCWLGVLVRSEAFCALGQGAGTYVCNWNEKWMMEGNADPVPAIVRALFAADPAFAARFEAAHE